MLIKMNTELRFAAYSSAPATAAVDFFFFFLEKEATTERHWGKRFITTATRKSETESQSKGQRHVQDLLFVFIWTSEPWMTSYRGKQLVSAVTMCVCKKKKTKGVCPRLHQQFKPLISPLQHPSVLHPALFTPHLSLSISPSSWGVTRTDIYSSRRMPGLLISFCLSGAFFSLSLVLQSMSQSISCSALSVFWTGCQSVC